MTVLDLRNKIEQLKGRREQIRQEITLSQNKLEIGKRSLRRHEQAREIVRTVGLRTQKQLQYHISDITTLALEAVYDNPYSLDVEFVQRRNKTECDLFFSRNKERIEPLSAAGGGTVNVAAFALRVASWSMQRPRSNNVLILDEPFGNVSTDLLPRASEMLKQISAKLKLQMIIITHAQELMENADKTFLAELHRGVTKVQEQ
jgi:DNA repair exonuclease SbcCD ATPase subunit